MGLIGRELTRKNIFAVFVGVFIAGTPVLAFDLWLSGVVDRQGQEEVDTSAKRAIALAEFRVTQTIGTLDDLAKRGVNSCDPSNIEAMRQANFDSAPIKEVAIIGPDGRTLCTDFGLPMGNRKLVVSEPLFGADGYTIEIVRLERGDVAVRLRRFVGVGPNAIAALVPAFLFLPQVSSQGDPFSAFGRITTANGAVIGSTGTRPKVDVAVFTASLKSEKFGFDAEISMPRGSVIAAHSELKWLSMFATGAIILALGMFMALIPRRTPGNPVTEIEDALWPENSCLTTSRSSTSAPASCAAPKFWCAGASPTAPWCCPVRSSRSRSRAG